MGGKKGTHYVHERMHTWDPAWQEAGPLDTSSSWRSLAISWHPLMPCQNCSRSSVTLECGLWCGVLLQGLRKTNTEYRALHHTAQPFQVEKTGEVKESPLRESEPDRSSFQDWGSRKWGKCLRKGRREDIYYYSEKGSFILSNKYKTLHIHFKHYSDLKVACYCHFHIMQMEAEECLTI